MSVPTAIEQMFILLKDKGECLNLRVNFLYNRCSNCFLLLSCKEEYEDKLSEYLASPGDNYRQFKYTKCMEMLQELKDKHLITEDQIFEGLL